MATTTSADYDRGREAERPSEIPKAGWRDIALRLNTEMGRDYVALAAAGVAFYFLLAIVPALTAMISIYGLVADPQTVTQQIDSLSGMIPPAASQIIHDQMTSITQASGTGLGLGAAMSILFALWSTSAGVKALIKGMNLAYGEEEKRGFIRLYLVTFALTIGAILFLILTAVLLGIVPAIASTLPNTLEAFVKLLRWPLLLVMVMIGLAVIYRFAPSRSQPQWAWVSVGAVLAAIAWLVGSALFSLYVSNFADYNETYGSLGAIVILMMWFWITAFVIILGAALNAEMEHQTRKDTTAGDRPRPMGQRQARKADTLGRQP